MSRTHGPLLALQFESEVLDADPRYGVAEGTKATELAVHGYQVLTRNEDRVSVLVPLVPLGSGWAIDPHATFEARLAADGALDDDAITAVLAT